VNLEFLRKQAKSLLKEYRAGDPRAVARIRAQIPHLGTEIKLADVHHALARESGHANWAALKHENAPLERFLVSIRGGALKDAQDAFIEFPDMADESIHAACTLGGAETVKHHLDLDAASMSSEHRGWPPLFYACASPFIRASGRQSAGILECVVLLLDRGADPNTTISNDPQDPQNTVSAAYRAMMSANMPVMMELMKRGARLDVKEQVAKLRAERPAMMDMFSEYFQMPGVRERMGERIAEMRKDPESAPWGAAKWWMDRLQSRLARALRPQEFSYGFVSGSRCHSQGCAARLALPSNIVLQPFCPWSSRHLRAEAVSGCAVSFGSANATGDRPMAATAKPATRNFLETVGAAPDKSFMTNSFPVA